MEISLKAIGHVESSLKYAVSHRWEAVDATIVIEEQYAAALREIEGFSHVWILFWMDQVSEAGRERYREAPVSSLDEAPGSMAVGLFATRTQNRPNPIGMTAVRLIARTEGRLRVSGLDALDGSPVLDIKPYLPPYDAFRDATMPSWAYG